MRNEIIILSGRQGSGKTTATNTIITKLREIDNIVVSEMMFAKHIKAMHDFCINYLNARGIYRDIKKDGALLQLLGTEWGRQTISNNIWVDLTKAEMDMALDGRDRKLQHVWIISDCRFRNEFDAFPEATKIRLECDRDVRKQRCEQWREKEDHISETDLDSYAWGGRFDYIFNTEPGKHSPEDIANVVYEEILFRRDNVKHSIQQKT